MKFSKFIQKYGEAYDHPITLVNTSLEDHPLIYVNSAFLELSGYEKEEVLGVNCRFLQGADTNKDSVLYLHEQIEKNNPTVQDLINYKKNNERFLNRIVLIPFSEDSQNFFLGLQHEIDQSLFKEHNNIDPLILLDRLVNPLTVLTTALWINSKDLGTVEKLKSNYLETFNEIKNFILQL